MNAKKQEVEITINPEGKVKVHIKGIKGKKCLELVDFLKQNVGEILEQKLTSEYYEPEPKVGINVKGK